MAHLTFNEFQRELNKLEIDPKLARLFTFIYEAHADLIRQQEETGKVMIAFANQLQGFVNLHEETQRRVHQLGRGMRPEGVDVMSVDLKDKN